MPKECQRGLGGTKSEHNVTRRIISEKYCS